MHKSFDCWQRGEEPTLTSRLPPKQIRARSRPSRAGFLFDIKLIFLFDIKLIRGGSNVNNLHVGSGLYLFSIVIGRLFNNVRGCEGELV